MEIRMDFEGTVFKTKGSVGYVVEVIKGDDLIVERRLVVEGDNVIVTDGKDFEVFVAFGRATEKSKEEVVFEYKGWEEFLEVLNVLFEDYSPSKLREIYAKNIIHKHGLRIEMIPGDIRAFKSINVISAN